MLNNVSPTFSSLLHLVKNNDVNTSWQNNENNRSPSDCQSPARCGHMQGAEDSETLSHSIFGHFIWKDYTEILSKSMHIELQTLVARPTWLRVITKW